MPLLFGASLIALEKKDSGVRPIAVGITLRRPVAKCAGYSIMQDMAELLRPKQLGFGISRGAEAPVMPLGYSSTTCSHSNSS